MIKIKVYRCNSGHVRYENSYMPESSYLYCVYFLGILIHSVKLYGVSPEVAEMMFGGKIINDK